MSRSSLSQFPLQLPRGGRAFSLRESLSHRVLASGSDAEVPSQSRRKPELALGSTQTCGVLDRCSQPRNQRPDQNLLIHWRTWNILFEAKPALDVPRRVT